MHVGRANWQLQKKKKTLDVASIRGQAKLVHLTLTDRERTAKGRYFVGEFSVW
jgi:hypothetical protein